MSSWWYLSFGVEHATSHAGLIDSFMDSFMVLSCWFAAGVSSPGRFLKHAPLPPRTPFRYLLCHRVSHSYPFLPPAPLLASMLACSLACLLPPLAQDRLGKAVAFARSSVRGRQVARVLVIAPALWSAAQAASAVQLLAADLRLVIADVITCVDVRNTHFDSRKRHWVPNLRDQVGTRKR